MSKVCPLCKLPLQDEAEAAMQVLGLSGWDRKDITQEVIKKAYKSIAHICHPDKGGDSEVFSEVADAKKILSESISDNPPKEEDKPEMPSEVKDMLKKRVKNWSVGKTCPLCGKRSSHKKRKK